MSDLTEPTKEQLFKAYQIASQTIYMLMEAYNIKEFVVPVKDWIDCATNAKFEHHNTVDKHNGIYTFVTKRVVTTPEEFELCQPEHGIMARNSQKENDYEQG